jgi:5-methyltetrahydrofolate--homocysteine methyltransferase
MTPNKTGKIYFNNISISEIKPFIHWTFFFMGWRLNGRYNNIDEALLSDEKAALWLNRYAPDERDKAHEALKLYRDAQMLLAGFEAENSLSINAMVGIFEGYAQDENLYANDGTTTICLPVLRQQIPSTDGFCYSLADFLKPENDYIGVFANTVIGAEEMALVYEKDDDMYHAILIKTLADRLAEATSEWLHYKLRTELWGYAPNEKCDAEAFFKTHYQGIRPAIGYPSLPDQSLIFELDRLVDFNKTGIQLTENGAMFPNASVCGIYFAHPQAKYFNIGKIDEEQFVDYCARRNQSPEHLRKWLAANL